MRIEAGGALGIASSEEFLTLSPDNAGVKAPLESGRAMGLREDGSQPHREDSPDYAVIGDVVDGINAALSAIDRRLQFLVHEASNRMYVKVIDKETDEVIRELPPERLLDLIGRIQEWV